MEPAAIGGIVFAVLLLLLVAGVHVGFAMGIAGFIGFAVLTTAGKAVSLVGLTAWYNSASFILICVPLFVLMGQLGFYSRIAADLYRFMYVWLGRLAGGLAIATTGACAAFAAITGSSGATAATMGSIALPEMKRYNYHPRLSAGCVAAAGTMGILIPPSLGMVIYGFATEESLGKLFMAGIFPGLLSAFMYMAMIYVRARRSPWLAPRGEAFSWKTRLTSGGTIVPAGAVFMLVMGGIYTGLFTPTEAAGIGAFGMLVVALAMRRLSWQGFRDSLAETVRITAMCMLIVIGAMIFAYFTTASGLATKLMETVVGLPVGRYFILIMILAIYVLLGCMLDVFGMLLLTLPIVYPIIIGLGFDGIWFGIIVTKMCEVALITPPIGINVYIVKGVALDVPMEDIFRGIFWFFLMDLVTIAILIAFPQISLFLPNQMFGG